MYTRRCSISRGTHIIIMIVGDLEIQNNMTFRDWMGQPTENSSNHSQCSASGCNGIFCGLVG